MNAGKFSRAFTLLKDLLAADPTHHEGRRLLATLLLKFGNLVTAKNAFDSLLKEAFQRQDYTLAESLLREYLAVGPRCIPFIEMLGEVYERKGDPIAAVIEYEKAIKVLIDDPDPDGTSRARELYAKIKSLAPGSFVVGRLAPKFEVASPSGSDTSEAIPVAPSSAPIVVTPPAVATLVSDAIAESKGPSVEEPTVLPKSLVSTVDVESPRMPSASPEEASASSPVAEVPAEIPPLRYATTEASPSPSHPDMTEPPLVSPPLRYAPVAEVRVPQPAPMETTTDEPMVSSLLRFVTPVDQETSESPPVEDPDLEEKVPFPPVNQMPPSASVAEGLSPTQPAPVSDSAHESDEALEARPFWDKGEEPALMSVESTETRDITQLPAPTLAPRPGRRTAPAEPPPPPEETDTFQRHVEEPLLQPLVSSEPAKPLEETAEQVSPEPTEPITIQQTVQETPIEPFQRTERVSVQSPAIPPSSYTEGHRASAEYPSAIREDDRHRTAPAPPKRRRKTGPSFLTLVRLQISIFIRRCVRTAGSVTRLIMFVSASLVVLALLSVGITAVVWLGLEEKPDNVYQELTKTTAPRLIEDPKANGYLLLLGFDASPQVDSVQVGHDRWLSPGTQIDENCARPEVGTEEKLPLSGWFRSADPAGEFKNEDDRLREWTASESVALTRYRQWLGMSFDDWGYGYMGGPDCAHILRVHRLYVAEGFSQDVSKGLDRLETDLTAWRNVLAQARTLSMKSMAAEAVKDDVSVMSGLLNRATLENRALNRMMRLARPLDPDERALRWPMQNEFMLEVKRAERRIRARADVDSAVTIAVKKMPVPKQRTLNAYAKYYDALIKSPQTGGTTTPKLYDFARTPARSRVDSFVNPLDNLLRTEPAPEWDRQIGVIMETDARLRLAGLQARLRGISLEQQIMAKVAQAGPAFFDPFTELPMLLNVAQSRLYSVGRDRKDDSGDPTFDVNVPLLTK